jgi:hypothetical protein
MPAHGRAIERKIRLWIIQQEGRRLEHQRITTNGCSGSSIASITPSSRQRTHHTDEESLTRPMATLAGIFTQ